MDWGNLVALVFGLLMLVPTLGMVIGIYLFFHEPRPDEVAEMVRRLREEEREPHENW